MTMVRAPQVRQSQSWRISKGLMLLGAMSYSLYLVHNQISQVLFRLSEHFYSIGLLLDLAIISATCLFAIRSTDSVKHPFLSFVPASVRFSQRSPDRGS